MRLDIGINEHAEHITVDYDEKLNKLVDVTEKIVDYLVRTRNGIEVLSITYKNVADGVQGEKMLNYGYKYFRGKTFEEAEQKVIDFIKDCVIRYIEQVA